MSNPENLEIADKPVQLPESKVRMPLAILSSMQLKDLSLRDLVKYCLDSRDNAGWEEFLQRTRRYIEGILFNRFRSWRPSSDLIADLRQEVYTKLLNNNARLLRSFEGDNDGQLFNYISKTVHSVAADYCRRIKTIPIIESIDEEGYREPQAKEMLHSRTEMQERWYLIEECLDRMESGEEERVIFYLFYRQGYSAREIGELSSIQLPTRKVENILWRLVRGIRAELNRGDDGKGSGANV